MMSVLSVYLLTTIVYRSRTISSVATALPTTFLSSVTGSRSSLTHQRQLFRSSSLSLSSSEQFSSSAQQQQQQPRSQSKGELPKAGQRTALVWLRTCLRTQDNYALAKGIELGKDGLSIVFTWERGPIPQTPSSIFECAAAHALDKRLRSNHQYLVTVHTNTNGGGDAAAAVEKVATLIHELNPTVVIVDAHEHPQDAIQLQKRFPNRSILPVSDENVLLVPFSKISNKSIFGRSREGGGKILRWSTYLSKIMQTKDTFVSVPLEEKKTQQFPPPIQPRGNLPTDSLPDPTAAGKWAEILVQRLGEISEEEAIRRATAKKDGGVATRVSTIGNGGDGKSEEDTDTLQLSGLGNQGQIPTDTKLSPYLRWGVLSPRQALKLGGVRKRDLLWRDWSHLCYYKLVNSLQRGEPVVKKLDLCYNVLETKNNNDSDNNIAIRKDNDKELMFFHWCVGNTGSELIDASMKQLWVEGWMPRHNRLLVASCLIEGFGLDWRLGKDWFQYTLIDHDYSINEMMWQNCGFCGLDPYYKALKWEKKYSEISDNETKHYNEYIQYWLSKEEKGLIHWPSNLRQYAKGNPPKEWIESLPTLRRNALHKNGVYKTATRVTNSGVRVIWPGSTNRNASGNNDKIVTKNASNMSNIEGEVWGIGRVPIDKFKIQ